MKSYDEIANSVFERRDEYVANKKRKKRIIISIITPIICCCVVLITSFGLWKSGIFSNNIPVLDNSQNAFDNSNNNSSLDNNQNSSANSSNSSSNPSNNSSTQTQNEFIPNNNSSENTQTNNNHQSGQDNSANNNDTTTSDNTETNNNNSENIDNGVLEKASPQEMLVPVNMKLFGSDKVKEENNSKTTKATVVLYQLDGDVVNWTTENDFLYVITSGNNRLVIINSKTMMAVSNIPLAGVPAEMNLIGDKIYISLPDLCRIDIFSKSNFTKTSSLHFEHEVSSFCVDGNYIYYSEHDQHCKVYKKNITTNKSTQILPDRGFTFYQPKLYLNKQNNILYIGETGHTGSTLYYFDAKTLQLKSLFRKNDYGIMNHTRDIFLIENEVFWGNYRLSATNAKQIVGRYGKVDYGSVNFASKELVSTFEGLFLADTYECIVNYFDAKFKFEYVLTTESNNFFFRERSFDKNIILGVNFSIQ